MNIAHWIERFRENDHEELLDFSVPVDLAAPVREELGKSLAIFQLGESGEGSTLFRYAEKVGATSGYEDYPTALRLFIEEEHRHARLLAQMVERLGGTLITKQWSAGAFRRFRKLINIEFHLQMFLTAEIIAEAYYDLLRRHSGDPVITQACGRILKDEVGHLGFHAAFFHSWMSGWSQVTKRLWRLQCQGILQVIKWGVWFDHRRCLTSLGVTRNHFFDRVARAERSFLQRTFMRRLPRRRCPIEMA